jgi:hypothetical protein
VMMTHSCCILPETPPVWVMKSFWLGYDWPTVSSMSSFSVISSNSSIFFSRMFCCCEADRRVYLAGRAHRWSRHCDCLDFARRRIQFRRIWRANRTRKSNAKA